MPSVDRQSLVFFIIMFIFLTLPNGQDQPHSYQERQTLTMFQKSITENQQALANRQYDQGYGNLTGFLLSYDDMKLGKKEEDWPLHDYKDTPWVEDEKFSLLPNVVSDKVKSFWGNNKVDLNNDNELGYLFNISGKLEGKFKKDNDKSKDIEKFPLKLPKYLRDYFESINSGEVIDDGNDNTKMDEVVNKVGNLTFDEGKIVVSIKSMDYNYKNPALLKTIKGPEDKIDDAVIVELKMNLMDDSETNKNEISTYGIYFQDSGSIISITNSGKFAGHMGVPSLTMNEHNFDTSKKVISQYLNGTALEEQLSMDDMNNFIVQSFEQCEFINYFKLEKTEFLIKELREIDEELVNPSGKPISHKKPKIKISEMLLYSPDCGIIIEDAKVEGEMSEIATIRFRHVFMGFLVIIALQMYLLLNQIEKSKTPGQLSNISCMTLFILQYQDALIALIFLIVSTIFEKIYLLLVTIAIVTYIMCGIFEMGFLTQVIKTQMNERGTSWWEILRSSAARINENESRESSPNTPGDTNTPNNTNPPNETVQVPNVNDDANIWNGIFAPGFAMTIISTFLILNSSMWRRSYRKTFEMVGLTLLNSYWIPQFLRNTLKNRRTPFDLKFILGTTILRLIPIYYVNLFSTPFNHEHNTNFVIFITIYQLIQLGLLYIQNFNPRFWINDKWLPKAYNYHPIINLNDLEHYGSDLLSAANIESNDEDETIIKTDCAICMNDIHLPIFKNKTKKVPKDYMVTPCFHIFHSECLEDWMKYKLQCPICRNGLPPL